MYTILQNDDRYRLSPLCYTDFSPASSVDAFFSASVFAYDCTILHDEHPKVLASIALSKHSDRAQILMPKFALRGRYGAKTPFIGTVLSNIPALGQ